MQADVIRLLSQVKDEGTFDVTDAVALNWLSRRHQTMCVRSRCYRQMRNGVVPAGGLPDGLLVLESWQGADIPHQGSIVEFMGLSVDGVPWGRVDFDTFQKAVAGYAQLVGGGGIWTHVLGQDEPGGDPDYAGDAIRMYPVPDGEFTLSMYQAMRPADWDVTSSFGPSTISQIRVPQEFEDDLVAGAIATGLARVEQRPDLAAPFERQFDARCEELRRLTIRKYRGSGPSTIRVVGYDA